MSDEIDDDFLTMSDPNEYRLLKAKAAALTSEELERRVVEEMLELNASGAGMRLELHPAAAFAVVGFVQLALRHPAAAANANPRRLAREFVEYVRAKFEPHAPAVALAIERGNLPEHDAPREVPWVQRIRDRKEGEPEPPEMEQERALLRRLLNSRDPLENARLTFGNDKHQIIFQRIMDLHDRGEPVDRVALANELMKNGELQAIGGLAYLVTLYEPPPHDAIETE